MTADPTPRTTPLPLVCEERGCALPYLVLRGDIVYIESDHRGKRHCNWISLHTLAARAGWRLVPVERDGV